MAPRPPVQINYSRPFYFAMLALGLTALAFVFMMASGGMQPALNVPGTDVLVCMGYYMLRALNRLRDPGPVIEVRPEGVQLRIRQPRRFLWQDVTMVAMGRHRLRSRLEITVSPELFAELRLPNLFVDDNFAGIRTKPFTIGITGQGLDRPLSDAFEEIRRHRPNLVVSR
ncbi:MAG: hypothetical protein K0S54_2863 [Alphaproteobacteria bacterium]|nr:hypothetical protein [Alphaproteobacteria bacterium]